MMLIDNHLPVLQVIFPLFGGLFAALSFNQKIAEIIAIITILCCLILSIHGFDKYSEIAYAFGNWHAPIGIEYRLDFLNFPLFIFVNATLLFLLVFCRNLIQTNILKFITHGKQHLFYSILLFAHMGYIGMLSTNDLFNLYVFIEISSLSAYVLMAQGNNKYASRGAFDYLIIGSIGATLILIGIGFLLNLTGSLNITDIKLRLTNLYDSRIVLTASFFIILGIILKMAFFPLHFWMIRAYNSASSVVLIYLASISGIVGACLFLRFVYFALDYSVIKSALENALKPIALITIPFCSYLALKARNLKSIIVYSSASQVGYIILLLSITDFNALIFQLLVLDGINKISLFMIAARNERGKILQNSLERFFIVITLICSAGLPLSSMFITKINIIETLIQKEYWLDSFVIIISSAIMLLYNFKMAKLLLQNNKIAVQEKSTFGLEIAGMICLMLLQIFMLNSSNWIKNNKIWDELHFLKSNPQKL